MAHSENGKLGVNVMSNAEMAKEKEFVNVIIQLQKMGGSIVLAPTEKVILVWKSLAKVSVLLVQFTKDT